MFHSILEATGDVSKELFQEVLHRDSCVAIFTILFILSFFGSIDSDIHRENVCQVNSYWHRPNILCDWKISIYDQRLFTTLLRLIIYVPFKRVYDAESRQEILYTILKDSLKTEDVAKMENDTAKNSHEVFQALRNSRGLHDSYLYR